MIYHSLVKQILNDAQYISRGVKFTRWKVCISWYNHWKFCECYMFWEWHM